MVTTRDITAQGLRPPSTISARGHASTGEQEQGPPPGSPPRPRIPFTATGRAAGGRLVLAAAAVYAVLWMFLRDQTASLQGQFGELVGAEAVLSMTVSAVLAVGSPRVDVAFGGAGRRQRWHRGTALIGLALVIAHLPIVVDNYEDPVGVILAVVSLLLFGILTGLAVLTPGGWFGRRRGPLGWIARLRYDRWKAIHRLTAGALLAGMGHGLLDSSALRHQPVLAAIYLAICLAGTAALGYQLILRRSLLRGSEHRVLDVRQVAADVRVITMRPMGEPWAPAPGQYVDVEFAGIPHGAHPFTVVRSDSDGTLQIAVKANGNDTMAMHDRIGTGARAWVQEPRGDFHYQRVDERQIWIAAGIGITPFLSWIRSLSEAHQGVVDLWYSVRGLTEAPFLDEVTAAARAFPWLHLHLVVTQRDGRLTAQRVLTEGMAGRDASAFLCGPPAMIRTFARDLRALGLIGSVHHEAFSPR